MTSALLKDLADIHSAARASGVPADRIQNQAKRADQAGSYYCLHIPKRGRNRRGQVRVVYKAKAEWLSQLHRAVAMIVVNSVDLGEHVQGFIKRRSIRTNAEFHLGAKQLLHADITNFFDSITTEQVKLALVSVGTNIEVADTLSRACTIDGLLRQGTRCSPALANLVCRKIDMEMLSLAKSCGATYTRYADDITFSGDEVPESKSVEMILNQNGFRLRDGRCFSQYKGRGQFVTGLSIADGEKPRLPRRLKRRLRLVLHYIEKNGVEAHFANDAKWPVVSSLNELEGMLCFVRAIEPNLARKFYQTLQNSRHSTDSQDSFDPCT